MHKLFLLDGMALVYRAHFAFFRNPIITSKGVNTSAVYGFANTLLDIMENHGASHIGVAFDTEHPTPRHELYPDYKAQREAMPEELAAAIPLVKQLCAVLGIPVLELDGYEADDIIGTIAHRADQRGDIHTYMVTPDKDFAQLVTATSTMWKPGRQGGNHELLDVAAIQSQWQVQDPQQVIDILGLWGDASDNIPGVPGIGEKTAKKLVSEFGSMENLLSSTGKLKGKQKENLENFADQARLSKKLATIMLDVPIEVTWEDLSIGGRDDEAARKLLAELEFNTIGKRIFGKDFQLGRGQSAISQDDKNDDSTPTPEELPELHNISDTQHHYHIVNTVKGLHSLAEKLSLAKDFCFDLETTSLDPRTCEILGIAFALKPHEAYYVDTGRESQLNSRMVLDKLSLIFQSKLEKTGHNLKFDLSVLLAHGCNVSGPFIDTMLVHSMVYPDQRHNMDHIAQTLLGYNTVKLEELAQKAVEPAEDLFGLEAQPEDSQSAAPSKKGRKKDIKMELIPAKDLAEYAAEDADITLQIAQKLWPEIASSDQLGIYRDIEAPLIPVLTAMENEGIALDAVALKDIGDTLGKRISDLSREITLAAGRDFNLNSPKQLGEILFGEMQLVEKPKKTKTGQFKTDEQTLATLAASHPIVANILDYREASKLKSTYVDALPGHISKRTGRIHTHFHQLLTSTGRLASSEPNLQNIPVRTEHGREIRKAFVPRDKNHTLLAADYSQVELRIIAALSGDQSMISAIKNELDIHTATAARVFGTSLDDVTPEMRRSAKMVNFGIIYGISAFGLAQRLGIGRTEAKEIIETYLQQYPGIKQYMDETIESARENGYVTTLSGRKCWIRNIDSRNATVRHGAERAAINAPVQGTAADMIKIAMIRVHQLLERERAKTRMILQVHDELLFDLHLGEEQSLTPKIVHTMESSLSLPHQIPCKVDTGTGSNWLEAH